jgi:predicted nucleotidyltransferase
MIGDETNMVGMSPLAGIFATPTLAALLAVLAREPDRSYYQKELVEASGGSLYLVQRELKRLETAGLVARTSRGRHVEYRARTDHPAFAGLSDALLRSIALGDVLRNALSDAEGVRLAFVFGSLARGEDTADSDVDLFVVGTLGLRDVATRVMPRLREIGREPNIVVMPEDDFRARMISGEHFVTSVLAAPKLWLVGDDHELAALSG